jgi:hypothetical protein
MRVDKPVDPCVILVLKLSTVCVTATDFAEIGHMVVHLKALREMLVQYFMQRSVVVLLIPDKYLLFSRYS